jgi:hypothetical protein
MNATEKSRLISLAGQYAECARSPVMTARREKWRLHNTLQEKTCPFHIEDNGSYFADLTPPLECADPLARELEARLLHALTAYETIDDDRIVPDRFVVPWRVSLTPLCEELSITRADNGRGNTLGYSTSKPIQDLDADWHKLKKQVPRLDREGSERAAHLAREVFEGRLPVEIGRVNSLYSNGITNQAVLLMGMQELYLQMAMNPEGVHRLFSFLAENLLTLGAWEEDRHLLTLNHDGNEGYCTGSSLYSDETAVAAGEHVMASDRFGYLESQESAGISADMFGEFVMPHFRRLADKFKLLMFGCCEPVHDLMPALQRLHGLRKVSVTPWCNLEKLVETCAPDIIWCSKPIPLTLCGDTYNPAEQRRHLREILDIGRDWFVEFVYRDTCLLSGAMQDRVAQTCATIREITGHPEGGKRT